MNRKRFLNRKLPRSSFALLCLLLGAGGAGGGGGCAPGADDIPQGLAQDDPRSLEAIYNTGLDRLLSGDRFGAIQEFNIIELQYPYSVWTRRASLLSAYAHYLNSSYEEAIAITRSFIGLYPGNANVPYAYYLNAMAHFDQLDSVDHDPLLARQALGGFEAITRSFPDSAYAADSHAKIRFLRAYLAGREMYLGRYYMRRGEYVGALQRFQSIIAAHQQTPYVPEALHRLVEIYLAIGMTDEAKRWAAILGHNFPSSAWYKRTYALFPRAPTPSAKR